jgi:hypothetical protein
VRLSWRRLRLGHYIALSSTHTFEAARYEPEGVTPFWVRVVRYWPGDTRDPGSIYDMSGLGHFATFCECREMAERHLADSELDSRCLGRASEVKDGVDTV